MGNGPCLSLLQGLDLLRAPQTSHHHISHLVLQVLEAGPCPLHIVTDKMQLPLESLKADHVLLFMQHWSGVKVLRVALVCLFTCKDLLFAWHANLPGEALSLTSVHHTDGHLSLLRLGKWLLFLLLSAEVVHSSLAGGKHGLVHNKSSISNRLLRIWASVPRPL